MNQEKRSNESFCCSGAMKHPRQAHRFGNELGWIVIEALLVFFVFKILPFTGISKYAAFAASIYALIGLVRIIPGFCSVKDGIFIEPVSLILDRTEKALLVTVFPEKLDNAFPKKLIIDAPYAKLEKLEINNHSLHIRGQFLIYAAQDYRVTKDNLCAYAQDGFTHRWLTNFKNEIIIHLIPEQEDMISAKIQEFKKG